MRQEPIAKFISTGKFQAFSRTFPYALLEIANEKCRVIVGSPKNYRRIYTNAYHQTGFSWREAASNRTQLYV